MADQQKPVHEVRLGRIKATIWANEVNDVIRHNVQVRRIYKDGDDWKTPTDSIATICSWWPRSATWPTPGSTKKVRTTPDHPKPARQHAGFTCPLVSVLTDH
jgi:hypothetical protein